MFCEGLYDVESLLRDFLCDFGYETFLSGVFFVDGDFFVE